MEEKITINDIFPQIGKRCDLSVEEVELFMKELFNIVSSELSEDNPIKIKDFGTFKLTPIQARESVDVNTGEKIEIPAHNRITFLPATTLKELVNKPFSHFETTLINDGFSFEDIPSEDDDEEDEMESFTPQTDVLQTEINEELVIKVEETENPVFNETIEETQQATNITETIFPQTRIHTITKSSKKTPYGIWGVLGAAAAMVGAAFLMKKK